VTVVYIMDQSLWKYGRTVVSVVRHPSKDEGGLGPRREYGKCFIAAALFVEAAVAACCSCNHQDALLSVSNARLIGVSASTAGC